MKEIALDIILKKKDIIHYFCISTSKILFNNLHTEFTYFVYKTRHQNILNNNIKFVSWI